MGRWREINGNTKGGDEILPKGGTAEGDSLAMFF